jgi:hypothetical protein
VGDLEDHGVVEQLDPVLGGEDPDLDHLLVASHREAGVAVGGQEVLLPFGLGGFYCGFGEAGKVSSPRGADPPRRARGEEAHNITSRVMIRHIAGPGRPS